jgi:ParB-like chromosome segregation protein Spo0J
VTTSTKTKPGQGLHKSDRQAFFLPIRQIVEWTDMSYPFTQNVRDEGWGWLTPLENRQLAITPELTPVMATKGGLWALGISEALEDQAIFASVVRTDTDILPMIHSFLGQGQLQPIEVMESRKKLNGKMAYNVVFGRHRTLTALAIWCANLIQPRAKEPMVEAVFYKGTQQNATLRSLQENYVRKGKRCLDEGEAYYRAVRSGVPIKDIADQRGISPQTVQDRIALLLLEPAEKESLAKGQIKYLAALKLVRRRENGDTEAVADASNQPRERTRTPQEIRDRLEAVKDDMSRAWLNWFLRRSQDYPG